MAWMPFDKLRANGNELRANGNGFRASGKRLSPNGNGLSPNGNKLWANDFWIHKQDDLPVRLLNAGRPAPEILSCSARS
jgi:hypothetical protein